MAQEGVGSDLLDSRLAKLGDALTEKNGLAERVPWDEKYRGKFQEALSDVKQDVADMSKELQERVPFNLTRRVLAQGPPRLPTTGIAPHVVPAYPSLHDLRTDYLLDPVSLHRATSRRRW